MNTSRMDNTSTNAMNEGRRLSRALLIGVTIILLALASCMQFGCQSIPISDADAQLLFDRAVTGIREHLAELPEQTSTLDPQQATNPTTPDPTPDTSADAINYTALKWQYGGINAASSPLDTTARIANLSASSKSLSYSWQSGGCQALGASSDSDYSKTLCAAFFLQPDGSWVGGKFDWISTSRTDRELKHMIGPGYYSNWSQFDPSKSTAIAFVIISVKTGKRTNIITTNWQR